MTIDNEQLLDELGRATMLARRTRQENAMRHHHAHKGAHRVHPQPAPYPMTPSEDGMPGAAAPERAEGCGCHGHAHGEASHGHGPGQEHHHGHGCHGHGGHHGKGGCHGGGHGKRRVLAMLSMNEGISQKDLAFLLGIRPQSLSETLARLQEAEYIERRPDDADKRIMKVYLTDKGREHAQHCAQMHQAMAADVFSVLTEEEKDQLFTILNKLSQSLENRERAPKPGEGEPPVV